MSENKEIDQLIKIYDISGRQLYNLAKAWTNFKRPIS